MSPGKMLISHLDAKFVLVRYKMRLEKMKLSYLCISARFFLLLCYSANYTHRHWDGVIKTCAYLLLCPARHTSTCAYRLIRCYNVLTCAKLNTHGHDECHLHTYNWAFSPRSCPNGQRPWLDCDSGGNQLRHRFFSLFRNCQKLYTRVRNGIYPHKCS